jgi:hypothetical protein
LWLVTAAPSPPRIRAVPTAPNVDEVAARLDRIQVLIDQLAKVRGDPLEQLDLASRINREIEAARLALQSPRE